MSASKKMSDAAAAAKCSMDKTKAILHEKGEKMTIHDPVRKKMAKHTKEVKIGQAELTKQAEYANNTAEKLAKRAGHHPTGTGHHTTGTGHHTTGTGHHTTGTGHHTTT